MASVPITSWQIDGKQLKQWQILYFGAPRSLQTVTAAAKLKDACSLEEKWWQPKQHIKKQRYYFADKSLSNQSYGFSGSHVWMWALDHKESWVVKNWCFWTVVSEKTLESPLDRKEIKPANPKGNQSWIFTGRTDAEAEAPILWPPDTKNWLTGKDPDVVQDWRREEKGTTEDETVGWHYRLNRHEFEQALVAGDGHGSPACWSPWGRKELDMTEWLNWTWDFPGSPLVKTPGFHYRGRGFNPSSGMPANFGICPKNKNKKKNFIWVDLIQGHILALNYGS